jgi:hypothetical protein
MFYLAQIKAGLDGHLLPQNQFTTDSASKPTLSELYLSLLGFLSRPLNPNQVFLYHLSRLAIGSLYLLVIYYFLSLFLKNPLERLCAFSLSIFTSSLPKFENGQLSIFLSQHTFLDALFRPTFIPQHLLRHLFLYLLIIFFLKKNLPLLIIFSFLLALSAPHSSLIFLLTTFVFLAVNSAKKQKTAKQSLLLLAVLFFPALIGVYFLNQSFQSPYGQTVKAWDANLLPPLPLLSFAAALGPTFFLALPALFNKKTYQKKFFFLPLFLFFALIFTVSPVEKFLPISHLRFLQIPLFPILSILSIQGIKTVFKKDLFLILVTTLSILISIPSYLYTFREQTTYHLKNPTNFYIKKTELEALNFLDKNTNRNEAVFTGQFNGNLLPGFTDNSVYVGHIIGTFQYAEKAQIAENFFQGKLSPSTALALFEKNEIKYIWFGEDQAFFGTNLPQTYPQLNLKIIFQNLSVTIYKVNL